MKILLFTSLFVFCFSLTSKAQVAVTYTKVSDELNSVKKSSKQLKKSYTKKSGSTLKRTVKVVDFDIELLKDHKRPVNKRRKDENSDDIPF